MLKRALIVGMLCVSMVSSSLGYATAEEVVTKNYDTTRTEYVILRRENGHVTVSTEMLTGGEAAQLSASANVIVEENSYVYGSRRGQQGNGYGQGNKKQPGKRKEKNSNQKKTKTKKAKDSKKEWNIQAIKADETAITYSGDKIKVAIIDSGVDFTADIDVVRKNFIPEEEDVSIIYEDTCGHGTSVAGIIAAKDNDEGITGINPNVELYSAKVLDTNCKAPVDRVVDAIYWAMEQGVDIINISFGTATDNQALKQAIEDAYHAGILLVAAAGNHDVVEYPAAYEEVIAVGSVDTQGERSEGSAVGEALELVAPGEQILSTGDFGGLSVSSGTSMSAPHVTGVASVLWQKDTSVSADFIRQLLAYSANLYGAQDEYGYGLIDLNYALSIYDEFKEIYNSNTASTFAMAEAVEETEELLVIEENQSEVVVFDDWIM